MRLRSSILFIFVPLIVGLCVVLFIYHKIPISFENSSGTDNQQFKTSNDKDSLQVKIGIQDNLKKTILKLSREIGSRGYLQTDALLETADYISAELERYGYTVSFQSYEYQGREYKNIHTEIKGRRIPEKILVIGAHYDTVSGTPGADDNASGVAGMLELARLMRDEPGDMTVRFVAFTLEEPPLFRSRYMGSFVYARNLREKGENIEGMICLESIGFFTDKPKSQLFPISFFRWIYPDRGNFITFVSNFHSRDFLQNLKKGFQKGSVLPVESIATFSIIPGIDFSDHRSFWKQDFKAIMVTDTAFYRNPHYHSPGDVFETLDFERMAELVLGLKSAVHELNII
jgi:Zn-dependent M28 family amino/carboxypeptidase